MREDDAEHDPDRLRRVTVLEVREYAALTSTVGEARRFVRDTLAGASPSMIDDAELLLSEVATNVVEHARTEYEVRITVDAPRVRVEVRDGSAMIPALRDLAAEGERGRGLHLIQHIATAWGVESRPGGKCVWFELQDGPGTA